MEKLFSEYKLDPPSDDHHSWLVDNVFHPFANGTGFIQVYDTLANKPLDLYKVPQAKTFSTDWCVQAVSSAAGAVVPFVVAGKATGLGMNSLSERIGAQGLTAKFLASESAAQVLGAGLYSFAQKPAEGQSRLSAAASTMAGFAFFSAGNALMERALPSISSNFTGSLLKGSGRFMVGAAAGLGSYETGNFVNGLQGIQHESNWNERFQAMANGGFVNVALPVVQDRVGKVIDGVIEARRLQAEEAVLSRRKVPESNPDERLASLASSERTIRRALIDDEAGRSDAKGIVSATENYEKWASSQIKLLPEDLAKKHADMAEDPFKFMRGSYYRWAEKFPELLPDLASAPKVNSVGDLHIENFGTWTDKKGRTIWGINDFDEAYKLPYTNDLVRLVTSANLLKQNGGMKLSLKEAADAVLDGYTRALKDGGEPFVISGKDQKLGDLAKQQAPEPAKFWRKLDEQISKRPAKDVPSEAVAALKSILPDAQLHDLRIGHRQAGVGSLGRERYAAMATADGKPVAAEVKSLLPSANSFVAGKKEGSYYTDILSQAVREADPQVKVGNTWIARSLSPSRFRIELGDLTHAKAEADLLWAMGYEAANVQLGSKGAAQTILSDLKSRNADWLMDAAKVMSKSTIDDQSAWKASQK